LTTVGAFEVDGGLEERRRLNERLSFADISLPPGMSPMEWVLRRANPRRRQFEKGGFGNYGIHYPACF
jgi:hypothetical protein